ncbi:MAG: hypothetical protein ABI809_14950 [Caldimonas sp.]
MIWAKTDAGRLEMQTRERVKERARRNLLLLIDGTKSEAMLLEGLAGIAIEDFAALEALGLIETVAAPRRAAPTAGEPDARDAEASFSSAAPGAAPLDHAQFTTALTQLISGQLGLRGFVLTLAVEKASTIEELQAVAQRALEQIRARRGDAAAETARQTLYGA